MSCFHWVEYYLHLCCISRAFNFMTILQKHVLGFHSVLLNKIHFQMKIFSFSLPLCYNANCKQKALFNNMILNHAKAQMQPWNKWKKKIVPLNIYQWVRLHTQDYVERLPCHRVWNSSRLETQHFSFYKFWPACHQDSFPFWGSAVCTITSCKAAWNEIAQCYSLCCHPFISSIISSINSTI